MCISERKPRFTLLPQPESAPPPGDRVGRILSEVASLNGVTVAELKGPSRKRHIVRPRRMACLRLHEELGMSLSAIGRVMHRDHTSVLYGIRQARRLIKEGLIDV